VSEAFAIRVEGLRELQKALRQIENIDGQLQEAHRKASMIAARATVDETPIGETGRLFRSVRGRATKTEGRVTIGSGAVKYAGPVHFGWPKRNIKPNKFAYRGIAKRQRDILDAYVKDTNRILKNAGLTVEG